MKLFRLALATLFLGAVASVGIGTAVNAQTTNLKCNCMVFNPGAPGQYGHRSTDTCTVTTCYI